MPTSLLKITEYCVHYNIEPAFMHALEESGIIAFTMIDQDKFIHEDQFIELERYVHFHYDLHINMEGIDAIRHLLTRVNLLQTELQQLQHRLSLHEDS